jgi:hypothetical protein
LLEKRRYFLLSDVFLTPCFMDVSLLRRIVATWCFSAFRAWACPRRFYSNGSEYNENSEQLSMNIIKALVIPL